MKSPGATSRRSRAAIRTAARSATCLSDDSGAWKSLTALIGHEQLKQFLDLNRICSPTASPTARSTPALRDAVKGSLLDLLSEQSSLSHPSMGSIWRDICKNCDLGIGTLTALATSTLPGQHKRLRAMMGERVLRITVKPFMDINTMIEERLTQCCVHVATVNETTEAHQCAPFCAVQAWAPLSRTRLSTATGRAARDSRDACREHVGLQRSQPLRRGRGRSGAAVGPTAALHLHDGRRSSHACSARSPCSPSRALRSPGTPARAEPGCCDRAASSATPDSCCSTCRSSPSSPPSRSRSG